MVAGPEVSTQSSGRKHRGAHGSGSDRRPHTARADGRIGHRAARWGESVSGSIGVRRAPKKSGVSVDSNPPDMVDLEPTTSVGFLHAGHVARGERRTA